MYVHVYAATVMYQKSLLLSFVTCWLAFFVACATVIAQCCQWALTFDCAGGHKLKLANSNQYGVSVAFDY